MDILEKIVRRTRADLELKKQLVSGSVLEDLAQNTRRSASFEAALRQTGIGIIAEVKKASPSKGVICADFDPVHIARSYQGGGAAAISVLTEPHYFQGDLGYLDAIGRAVSLPLLRKDFIIDAYQIYEAQVHGASALLLIVAVLMDAQLSAFIDLGHALGLSCLVEVHDRTELERALQAGARMIGVNNRNLRTFSVSLQTSLALVRSMPPDLIKISESGIDTHQDILLLEQAGFDGVLVGEALMRQSDRVRAMEALRGL